MKMVRKYHDCAFDEDVTCCTILVIFVFVSIADQRMFNVSGNLAIA